MNRSLKISSKKFSRVVVYCSVIKVLCRSFKATALIFYQSAFRLSRTFLLSFLSCLLSSRSAPGDSLYRLSYRFAFVNNFFTTLRHGSLCCFHRFPGRFPAALRSFRLRVSGRSTLWIFFPHQRQVLSYHRRSELSMFFPFFIYFRQFAQFYCSDRFFCRI